MSVPKILLLLTAMVGLLAVSAVSLFPQIGIPDYLTQAISFTASVCVALLGLIHRWRLPDTAAPSEQAAASLLVVGLLMFALNTLNRISTRLSYYTTVAFIVLAIILIFLLWDLLITRRPS